MTLHGTPFRTLALYIDEVVRTWMKNVLATRMQEQLDLSFEKPFRIRPIKHLMIRRRVVMPPLGFTRKSRLSFWR